MSKPKLYPHDVGLEISAKKQRKNVPPYFDQFLIGLPFAAGILACWAMTNLYPEITGAVFLKAVLVGIVVSIVSYAINRFAIDWGTELAASGYRFAGFFSLASMMIVGGCLWLFSFGGIVLPDVRNLRFEDHSIALSQHLTLRQEQASKALQLAPVIAGARDDLSYHSDCEIREGCVSRRGGGAGTLSRLLDERSRRAGNIAEQLEAGKQAFRDTISRANEVLGEYQTALNDDALSQKSRRQELIRLDAEFVSVVSGLEETVPLALIGAYAQELQNGVVIPNRPDATRAVNALLAKHGQALQSVLGGIEREAVAQTQFPSKAGLSDTLSYVGNFAPLAGVIWVAEGIFPLALWIYTWLFLIRQRDRSQLVREHSDTLITPASPVVTATVSTADEVEIGIIGDNQMSPMPSNMIGMEDDALPASSVSNLSVTHSSSTADLTSRNHQRKKRKPNDHADSKNSGSRGINGTTPSQHSQPPQKEKS